MCLFLYENSEESRHPKLLSLPSTRLSPVSAMQEPELLQCLRERTGFRVRMEVNETFPGNF